MRKGNLRTLEICNFFCDDYEAKLPFLNNAVILEPNNGTKFMITNVSKSLQKSLLLLKNVNVNFYIPKLCHRR